MGKDLNKVLILLMEQKLLKSLEIKTIHCLIILPMKRQKTWKKELERIIFDTRGSKGVATFKRMRTQATERDRQSKYAAVARKNKILNVISILLGVSITIGGGAVMIWAAIEFKP